MKIDPRAIAIAFLVVSSALAAVPACKTNTIDNGTNNNTNNTFANVVGASGGVINGPNGVQLRVPGGALTADTRITISIAEPDEYPPLQQQVAGAVYAFEPHGQKFLAPVTISLPGNATGGAAVLRAEPGDKQWTGITNGTFTSTSAEVLVSTFSFYALSPGSSPDTSPRDPTPPPPGTGTGNPGGSSGGTKDCGLAGLACCTSGAPCSDASTICSNGTCQPCGRGGNVCCANASCLQPYVCTNGNCVQCGMEGSPCCTSGTACVQPFVCDGTNTCVKPL